MNAGIATVPSPRDEGHAYGKRTAEGGEPFPLILYSTHGRKAGYSAEQWREFRAGLVTGYVEAREKRRRHAGEQR